MGKGGRGEKEEGGDRGPRALLISTTYRCSEGGEKRKKRKIVGNARPLLLLDRKKGKEGKEGEIDR